jgi:hypothetical protein
MSVHKEDDSDDTADGEVLCVEVFQMHGKSVDSGGGCCRGDKHGRNVAYEAGCSRDPS